MGATSSRDRPPPELAQHCTAGVALEKTAYVAGEIVRGYVQVDLRAPIRCQNVFAFLACEAKTKVHYTTHSGSGKHRRTRHHYAHERQSVYQLRAHVAQFATARAAPGRYQFPFEFQLPLQAPSTLHIPGVSEHCFVTHSVRVELQGCGSDLEKQQRSWPVHSVLLNVNGAAPVGAPTAQSQTKPVNVCCCISKGSVGLDSQLTSTACQAGGNVGVTLSVRNASSATCSGVIVSIREMTTWCARGHWHRSDRPCVEGQVHPQINPGQSVGPVTVQVGVPTGGPAGGCNPSLVVAGPCGISVAHRVRVQCKTACCVTDPFNDTNICVHGGPPSAEVFLAQATALGTVYREQAAAATASSSPAAGLDKGGGAMMGPIVAAIPYNPTGGGGGGGGGGGSVYATPQSVGVPVDTTGDGIADAIGFDTTGDGVIDSLDTNMDGNIDTRVGEAKTSANNPMHPSAPPAF
jgi:hypothetical protein